MTDADATIVYEMVHDHGNVKKTGTRLWSHYQDGICPEQINYRQPAYEIFVRYMKSHYFNLWQYYTTM